MSKRYYHYIGSACNQIAEFDDLADAIKSAEGDFVFDSNTKLAIYRRNPWRTWNAERSRQLAEEALNAACALIQDRLGQTDGGLASLYFDDNHLIYEILIDYIGAEISEGGA